MSKPTDLRTTPRSFFNTLDARYQFDLDVCATKANRRTPTYLGPGSFLAEDALADDCCWSEYGSRVWMNPPYSEIPNWLAKAVGEVRAHPELIVVALLPANTSARWWSAFIWDAERNWWRDMVMRVVFVDHRLTFKPHNQTAMWPSIVVEFNANAAWETTRPRLAPRPR